MEERIIDRDELRKVRVTRTDGLRDVVDDALPEEAREEAEEEMLYAVEAEAYDEDLVGLTPTQLREETERRARAAREAREACGALCDAGENALKAGDWKAAEDAFAGALLHVQGDARAESGLWEARTQGYTTDAALCTREGADALAGAGSAVRSRLAAAFREGLSAKLQEVQAEAIPLRAEVEAGQAERRAPFRANKNYYLVRLFAAIAAFVLFAIGIAVSASFLLRVQSAVPVVLTGAFGVLAFAALVFVALFARKTVVAVRLCRENEKLSSTEEGARLAALEARADVLSAVCDALQADDEKQSEA